MKDFVKHVVIACLTRFNQKCTFLTLFVHGKLSIPDSRRATLPVIKTQTVAELPIEIALCDRADKWLPGTNKFVRIESAGFSHGRFSVAWTRANCFVYAVNCHEGKWVRYDLTRSRESSSKRRIVVDDPVSSCDSMGRCIVGLKPNRVSRSALRSGNAVKFLSRCTT